MFNLNTYVSRDMRAGYGVYTKLYYNFDFVFDDFYKISAVNPL